MLLGFGYLYKFVIFYFLFLFEKQKIIDKKKNSWPKVCNIIFLLLIKIGSVGPVDQQINLVSPNSWNDIENWTTITAYNCINTIRLMNTILYDKISYDNNWSEFSK